MDFEMHICDQWYKTFLSVQGVPPWKQCRCIMIGLTSGHCYKIGGYLRTQSFMPLVPSDSIHKLYCRSRAPSCRETRGPGQRLELGESCMSAMHKSHFLRHARRSAGKRTGCSRRNFCLTLRRHLFREKSVYPLSLKFKKYLSWYKKYHE